MRIGLRVVAAIMLYLVPAVAQAQTCSSGVIKSVQFHSLLSRTNQSYGAIKTDDGTLSVMVTNSNPPYKAWTVLTPSGHGIPDTLHDAGSSDRTRVDVSAPNSQFTILLCPKKGGACTENTVGSCSISYNVVNLPTGVPGIVFALVEPPETWATSFSLGTNPVVLNSQLSVKDILATAVYHQGLLTLYLDGHVVYGSAVTVSLTRVTIESKKKGCVPGATGPQMCIDFPDMDVQLGVSSSVAVNTWPYTLHISNLACALDVSITCGLKNASYILELPASGTCSLAKGPNGGSELIFAANDDGSLSLDLSKSPCSNGQGVNLGTIGHFDSLTVKDAKIGADITSVQLSGTASFFNANASFSGLGFQRGVDGRPHPVGTVDIGSITNLVLGTTLKIYNIQGTVDTGSGAITLRASAQLNFAFGGGAANTRLAVSVNDLRLENQYPNQPVDLRQLKIQDWRLDFSNAAVTESLANSMFLDHKLQKCDQSNLPTKPTPDPSPSPNGTSTTLLCLGVHLNGGPNPGSNDVAYGYAQVQEDRDTGCVDLRGLEFIPPTPPPNPSATKSSKTPEISLRVGLGSIALSSFALRMTKAALPCVPVQEQTATASSPAKVAIAAKVSSPAPSPTPSQSSAPGAPDIGEAIDFSDVMADPLAPYMYCSDDPNKQPDFPISGQLDLKSFGTGKSAQPLDATARIGFGGRCTVISTSGTLQFQLSEQSRIVITSLTYMHSRKMQAATSDMPADPDLDLLRIGGVYTSGQITVVFNALGFRTSNRFHADKNNPDVDGVKGSGAVCHRQEQEYQLGNKRFCAIIDVNLPQTLALSAVQNTNEIWKYATQAAGIIFGAITGAAIK